jgi:hypothetical protein
VPADDTGAAKLKEAETSVRLCFMGSSRTSLISLSMHTHMGAITPSAIRGRKESGLLWKLFNVSKAYPRYRGAGVYTGTVLEGTRPVAVPRPLYSDVLMPTALSPPKPTRAVLLVPKMGQPSAADRRANDHEAITAFLQGLQQSGWSVGNNVQIDYRWSGGSADDTRKYAPELVALAPDVIFASGSAAVEPLRRATRTVPIVFVLVPDPVGGGFVESLARPGGNITGFSPWEYGIGAKGLELLKQIAPSVRRVAVLRDAAITAGIGLWGAIQSVSPSFGVELRPVDVRDAGEMERALAAFAESPNGGLILTGSALAIVHRDLIIALAAPWRCAG